MILIKIILKYLKVINHFYNISIKIKTKKLVRTIVLLNYHKKNILISIINLIQIMKLNNK